MQDYRLFWRKPKGGIGEVGGVLRPMIDLGQRKRLTSGRKSQKNSTVLGKIGKSAWGPIWPGVREPDLHGGLSEPGHLYGQSNVSPDPGRDSGCSDCGPYHAGPVFLL